MKPIAVLGCGPAGLLAAHACAMRGKKFVVLSRPDKSRLGGAQFLHEFIPGITNKEPEGYIHISSVGSPDGYKQKVYGDDPNIPFVSFPTLPTLQAAWSLVDAYNVLWEMYRKDIYEVDVTPKWIEDTAKRFKMIMSTVPAPSICWAHHGAGATAHMFFSQQVRIYPEAILTGMSEMTILYDGTKDRSWYRTSKIFGTGGTEYPERIKPPVHPLIMARKPIMTTCTCFPEVLRLGRHGQWKKGVLTHHAFKEASLAL